MRKLLIPFLITTLVAAIFAYMNNAYQKHKREAAKQEQLELERQQQERFGRERGKTPGEEGHAPLGRDSRDRPDR